MPNDDKTVLIEDAQIIRRNFEGKEGQFNAKGDRNFSVVLPKPLADELVADGWNVRCRVPQEGEEEFCHISVKVSFKFRPPTIITISHVTNKHTVLNEDTVELLDSAEIEKADLIFRAYEWDVNGKQGIKAYLQSLYVTLAEDALQRKYTLNEDNLPQQDEEG